MEGRVLWAAVRSDCQPSRIIDGKRLTITALAATNAVNCADEGRLQHAPHRRSGDWSEML